VHFKAGGTHKQQKETPNAIDVSYNVLLNAADIMPF